jgi:hypothetical protein
MRVIGEAIGMPRSIVPRVGLDEIDAAHYVQAVAQLAAGRAFQI